MNNVIHLKKKKKKLTNKVVTSIFLFRTLDRNVKLSSLIKECITLINMTN